MQHQRFPSGIGILVLRPPTGPNDSVHTYKRLSAFGAPTGPASPSAQLWPASRWPGAGNKPEGNCPAHQPRPQANKARRACGRKGQNEGRGRTPGDRPRSP
uniref:Uncharacterized protein n=1 Tax=Caulerpa lentillifera TaxID=148947 RepID=A0A2Z2QLK1_9CHLO|nr:hypothetical protein [Caulerpa lentillifera]AST24275.1 hypothetical protein [Caulerpa lentillifera]